MKVLTEGHKYELENFENKNKPGQTLQFIEKYPYDQAIKMGIDCPALKEGVSPEGILVTACDGTTNEDVLSMLIDRLNSLNKKFPCRENALAITKCEEALLWLNKRTADRVMRGVEGKQIA